MFALVPTAEAARARTLIEALRAPLPAPESSFESVVIGDRTLLWTGTRAYDEFLRSDDGVYFGTAAGGTTASARAGSALASGVLIAFGGSPTVTPVGLRGVFHDASGRVSDSTLLLASLNGARPQWSRLVQLSATHALLGRDSLFAGIDRVRPMHELVLAGNGVAERSLPVPEAVRSDDEFLELLVQLSTGDGTAGLALTGGYDSRTVLGGLLGAQRHVIAAHQRWRPADEARAGEVAAAAGCEFRVATNRPHDAVPDIAYVIATDAQVTYRAGSLSSLKGSLDECRSVYTGQFAGVATKNPWPQVYLGRPPVGDPLVQAVDRKLLRDAALLGCDRDAVRTEFIEALRAVPPPVDAGSRKALLGWHHYVHRGLRWVENQHADLAQFHEVLSPLGDLRLVLHGMRGSTWRDLAHERARLLNDRLGVGLGVGYGDGGPSAAGAPGALRRRLRTALSNGPVGQRIVAMRGVTRKPGRSLSAADLEAIGNAMPGADAEQIVAESSSGYARRALTTAAHACRVLRALEAPEPVRAVQALATEVTEEAV